MIGSNHVISAYVPLKFPNTTSFMMSTCFIEFLSTIRGGREFQASCKNYSGFIFHLTGLFFVAVVVVEFSELKRENSFNFIKNRLCIFEILIYRLKIAQPKGES